VDLIKTPHRSGPLDRRWELANAIVARAASRRFFGDALDPAVAQAIRFIKLRQKNRPDVLESFPNLSDAFRLRFQANKLTRSVLEARLLSGEPIADSAAKCNLPIDVVKWYRLLFFEVLGRLQCREFIFNIAIGQRYWNGYTEDDVDIILKSMAFLKGPVFLDYLLPYFTTAWQVPDRLDQLPLEQLERLRYMASIKAMIAAITMPVERAITPHDRLLAREPAVRWQGLAAELQELIAMEASTVGRTVSTSLSQASLMGMIDSFAAGRAEAAKSVARPGGEVEEPVAMAG
jgi:hypothetical protein